MLCQAASETAGLAIQIRGTLAGNIIISSPAADSAPALLAYDAEIELTSQNGTRWIPYHGFHTGYKKMQMGSDELLTRIRLPRRSTNCYHYYRKVGTRKAQAISSLAAVGWKRDHRISDVRIALGSVAPIVIRCVRTEDTLRDKAISPETIELARESLNNELTPIDDIRSTASYRLRVATNLLADFLEKLQID